jgi:hypothetical protein
MKRTEEQKAAGYLPELERLSWFIQDTATCQGKTRTEFYRTYGLSPQTIENYVHCQKFPMVETLVRLAAALRVESGQRISANTLLQLIDPVEDELNGATLGLIERASVQADQLLKQFKELPYQERLQILPELQRQTSRDVVFATGQPEEVLSLLVEIEQQTSGHPLKRLAQKAGLDVEIFELICRRLEIPDLSMDDVRRVSSVIRDESGNYGNVARFMMLMGFSNSIKQLTEDYMQARGLESVAELVDKLLLLGETSATAKQRRQMVDSVALMLEHDRLISQHDSVYEKIVPVLCKELGFDRVSDLVAALR